MKTIKLFLFITVLFFVSRIAAQETGTIKGTLTDEKGKNLPFVNVALMEDSTIISGTNTDDNGDFTFKMLTAGNYNLQFSFVGFRTQKVKGVVVTASQTSYVYKSLHSSIDTLGEVTVYSDVWQKPTFDATFSTVTSISLEQISDMAVSRSDIVGMIVNVTPGILPTDDGKDIYMRGSRRGDTGYYIDGNRVVGSPEVPGLGIAGMEVLTGGVPAEYGDCMGGLVIITTKDYKTEMRRKQMERTARKEQEQK